MNLVLVVDDDEAVLRTIVRILSRDFSVVSTCSPAKAIEMAKTLDLSAVVSDVSMPDMNGFELQRALLANTPSLSGKFIFLSGGGKTQDDRDMLEKVAYIQKPFSGDRLISAVRLLVDVSSEVP